MSTKASLYQMNFKLKTEKRLFLGSAVVFLICAIFLLMEQSYFVGSSLFLISGVIITFYIVGHIDNSKNQDEKPEYIPQYNIYPPCKV